MATLSSSTRSNNSSNGSSTPPEAEPEEESTSTKESPEEQRKRSFQQVLHSLSLWDFVNPSKPWVLVENGSFMGYFDWIPQHFRVGPWSVAAVCYLSALWYGSALAAAYYTSSMSRPIYNNDNFQDLEYPALYTPKWYYNVITTIWMLYVMKLIIGGPMSFVAWTTYTVQSWTLLTLRHALCALAPVSSLAIQWAEYIRFPVACSVSITFFIWNLVLAPFAYFVGMKTAEQKQKFLQFIFSFRLVQIHVFNIVFMTLNVYWASPKRKLMGLDLFWAVLSVVLYMAWYLLFFDRIGIHFYPVFSPRDGRVVAVAWTFLLTMYLAVFGVWRQLMWPSDDDDDEIVKA